MVGRVQCRWTGIDYFGRFVEQGQPALTPGCTGRLLLPWLAPVSMSMAATFPQT
jgi:hypothetical protein